MIWTQQFLICYRIRLWWKSTKWKIRMSHFYSGWNKIKYLKGLKCIFIFWIIKLIQLYHKKNTTERVDEYIKKKIVAIKITKWGDTMQNSIQQRHYNLHTSTFYNATIKIIKITFDPDEIVYLFIYYKRQITLKQYFQYFWKNKDIP